MKDKIGGLLAALKKNLAVTACVALVFLVIIVLVAVFSSAEDAGSAQDFEWGDGLTESIPAFSGEDEILTAGENGEYAAAYYSKVSGESVEAYIQTLEQELGIDFGEGEYPRSAVYGEKFIAIHYNVTEMTFSVTVAAKSVDISSTENTQIGD